MKQQTEPPSTLQGQYAGFFSRLLAFTIDLVVVIITITVIGISVDMFIRFFQLEAIVDALYALEGIVGEVLRLLAVIGVTVIIAFSYFVVGWTLTGGQSIGKILIGVRIVPLNGKRIGLIRSTIRYIAFLLSALILFLGLLWVLVSNTRQGWHDKISGTCVIYDWPAREDDGVIGRFQANVTKFRIARRSIRHIGTTTPVGDIEGEVETAAEEIEAVSSK